MKNSSRQPHPIAVAMNWVSRITVIGLEMVLPTVGGYYLDRHFGTRYWTLVGLFLGLTVGLWQLIRIAHERARPKNDSK